MREKVYLYIKNSFLKIEHVGYICFPNLWWIGRPFYRHFCVFYLHAHVRRVAMLNSNVTRDWLAERNFDCLQWGPSTSLDFTRTTVSVLRGSTLINLLLFFLFWLQTSYRWLYRTAISLYKHPTTAIIWNCYKFQKNRLCGILVRVPGYRSRGPGFNYQIFWEVVSLERGPHSLVRIIEIFQGNSGPGLENRN
jgi:hypothetical protein